MGAPTAIGSSSGIRGEVDHEDRHHEGEERRDGCDEVVQVVHVGGERGRPFRKQRNPREHSGSGAPFRGVARLAPSHQHNETYDETHGERASESEDVHEHGAVPAMDGSYWKQ